MSTEEQLVARCEAAEAELQSLKAAVAETATANKRPRLDPSPELEELLNTNHKLKYRLQILQKSLEEEKAGGGAAMDVDEPLSDDYAANAYASLQAVFTKAIATAFPSLSSVDAAIVPCSNKSKGSKSNAKSGKELPSHQCNAAMSIFSKLKGTPACPKKPHDVAAAIIDKVPKGSTLVRQCEVTGPGFINIYLHKSWVAKYVEKLVGLGPKPPKVAKRRVLVDFSSPNIAKEMHVGHLRSTIIGESISRILEFAGHEVLRINHVGDWGTQFGMLVAHLKDEYPNYLSEPPSISGLQQFYKDSKVRFDTDEEFMARAYQDVVKLQARDPDVIAAWNLICDVSRREFQKIYNRLDVTVEERGESFYQDKMIGVIKDLESKGLSSVEKDGRTIMWVFPEEEVENGKPPLMLVKSDGGFTYDTSDMAALRYRVEQDKADWLIYVVDSGQSLHFQLIFGGAAKAKYYDPETTRVDHVKFGVVTGAGGKRLKSRSGDTVKLKDLLDEGVERAQKSLKAKREARAERESQKKFQEYKFSPEEENRICEVVAYGCVKYSDLSHNRIHDYEFSFDQMLDDKGNTAVYLLYALARTKAIVRTAVEFGIDMAAVRQKANFSLEHAKEWKLAVHLAGFPAIVVRLMKDLLPHHLTDYVYELAGCFTEFYDNCYVFTRNDAREITAVDEERLLLCDATIQTMEKCCSLLGLETLERM